ncbi:MAG: hypothetical protein HS111_17620 [Kofleriaceae bacterium]|nr:hypothetical protein [Kofleriaceae bacterium]
MTGQYCRLAPSSHPSATCPSAWASTGRRLRDALKKLAHLGLVRIRQGDGTRSPTSWRLAESSWCSTCCRWPVATTPSSSATCSSCAGSSGAEIARLAAFRCPRSEGAQRLVALADKADAATSPLEVFETDFELERRPPPRSPATRSAGPAHQHRPRGRAHAPAAAALSNLTATPAVVRAHHRALIEAVQARIPERAAKIADDHLRSGAELAARMGGRAELTPQPLPAA